MIDGYASPPGVSRIEGIVRAAVSGLPVFCGGVVPAEATIDQARNCVLLSREDFEESRIEVRLPTCSAASAVADTVLGALEAAGVVREVIGRYDSPGLSLGRAGHTLEIAV